MPHDDDLDSPLGRSATNVVNDVKELGRGLSEKREDILESIGHFVQTRPAAAVGIAFGAGYILGGGLFTRTTSRLLAIGLRLGALGLARDAFERM